MEFLATVLLFFVGIGIILAGEPVVNCPAPRSPEHGQSFLYQDGRVVKYVCEPGYKLLGKEIVRCIEGEWEDTNPICEEISTNGEERPLSAVPPEPSPATRPLFNWGGEGDEGRENATSEGDEMPLSDEARLRMVLIPRRRGARILTSRVARLHTASELEDEEKKRSGKKDDPSSSTTTIHLETPPSVVYVRRTVSPGKSDSVENTLTQQYRTASLHMTLDNAEDADKLHVVALPRAAVSESDKGEESLRRMYWMAHQYYPRQASLVEYRTGSPVVQTLTESQMAWINSLHPELRDQYLKDLYVLRTEEAAEGARAMSFLRRYDDAYNVAYYPHYIRQPLVTADITSIYDYSCNQAGSSFVTAPKLPNAHIARYDRRQNHNHPHNHYLTAVYRCNPGYVMLDSRFTELTCSRRNWIGTEPICVPRG